MLTWNAISDADGFGTIQARMPVLLIAKYPGTNTWSDPVYGWRERLVDNPEREYARWYHDFPPTHYAFVNTPEE